MHVKAPLSSTKQNSGSSRVSARPLHAMDTPFSSITLTLTLLCSELLPVMRRRSRSVSSKGYMVFSSSCWRRLAVCCPYGVEASPLPDVSYGVGRPQPGLYHPRSTLDTKAHVSAATRFLLLHESGSLHFDLSDRPNVRRGCTTVAERRGKVGIGEIDARYPIIIAFTHKMCVFLGRVTPAGLPKPYPSSAKRRYYRLGT